jgi:phage baseplate assembly protein W
MYGLKMSNGDIVVDSGGVATRVAGAERVKQELSAWILEPIGTDPLYPRFGSRLKSMIGSGVTREVREEVREEILRIVSNYIEYQTNMLRTATQDRDPTMASRLYSPSDIVMDVRDIRVSQDMDVVSVAVS